jgi:hypothetical protein
MDLLSSVTADADGKPVVLAPTPSDYNDYTTDGEEEAHSTGCHINLLSPRPLEAGEYEAFSQLVSPLNALFGIGGFAFSGRGVWFSDDPRAGFIGRCVNSMAHGEAAKPFILLREQDFVPEPCQLLQVTAFARPRSPVSSYLQLELLVLALHAVLARKSPRWLPADPIRTLQARSDERVLVAGPEGASAMLKSELALENAIWLTEFARDHAARKCRPRFDYLSGLIKESVAANRTPGTCPVFPTDIAIKKILFDRIARMHGFDDLRCLMRRYEIANSREAVRTAFNALVVADVLYGSPQPHSTYEAACRAGVFVRPRFEQTMNPYDPTSVPKGICPRDRLRAKLIAENRIRSCDWHSFDLTDGTVVSLPTPWSDSMSDAEVPIPF